MVKQPKQQQRSAGSIVMQPGHIATQMLSYAGVGAIGTIAHYLTLLGLVELFGVNQVWASTFGAIVGALINYALNYFYTFLSTRPHRETAPRFAATAMFGIALNALVMIAVEHVLSPHYLAAQVIATGAVLCATFLINRYWTF